MVWTAEKILKSSRKEILNNFDEVKEYLIIKHKTLKRLEQAGKDVTWSWNIYNQVILHLVSLGIDVTKVVE